MLALPGYFATRHNQAVPSHSTSGDLNVSATRGALEGYSPAKSPARMIPYDSWSLYKSYWTRQIVENGKQLSQAVKKIECRLIVYQRTTHSALIPSMS